MKINYLDNKLVIYLVKDSIEFIDFNIKEQLEDYFKSLFRRLRKYYHIKIEGYYNIKVFIDKFYGVVLELEKEEISYYDYFENTLDMRISIVNNEFLYQISDLSYLDDIRDKVIIYKYNNNFIFKPKDVIDFIGLIEYVNIIYNIEAIESSLVKLNI